MHLLLVAVTKSRAGWAGAGGAERIIYPENRQKRNKMVQMGSRDVEGVKGREGEWEPGGEAWAGEIN